MKRLSVLETARVETTCVQHTPHFLSVFPEFFYLFFLRFLAPWETFGCTSGFGRKRGVFLGLVFCAQKPPQGRTGGAITHVLQKKTMTLLIMQCQHMSPRAPPRPARV